ncbi:hypothetical protein [Dyadobacter tibetensis]|uniref:hypothetical protein n=1 Tax=Dyadobacter tibetensis TaxID=1211851 RepID=UPI00046E8430|nr:hypothetical protein [Dyadobacter tibetensis]
MQNQEEPGKKLKNPDELNIKIQEGTYEKAGREETGSLPNDPAENAKKTSPEEDSGKEDDTKLSADR